MSVAKNISVGGDRRHYFEVISSSGNDKMSYDVHNNLLSHTDFK